MARHPQIPAETFDHLRQLEDAAAARLGAVQGGLSRGLFAESLRSHPGLTADPEARRLVKTADEIAWGIVLHHDGFAKAVTKQMGPDALQLARIGLYRATLRYRPGEASFTTYSRPWMFVSMQRGGTNELSTPQFAIDHRKAVEKWRSQHPNATDADVDAHFGEGVAEIARAVAAGDHLLHLDAPIPGTERRIDLPSQAPSPEDQLAAARDLANAQATGEQRVRRLNRRSGAIARDLLAGMGPSEAGKKHGVTRTRAHQILQMIRGERPLPSPKPESKPDAPPKPEPHVPAELALIFAQLEERPGRVAVVAHVWRALGGFRVTPPTPGATPLPRVEAVRVLRSALPPAWKRTGLWSAEHPNGSYLLFLDPLSLPSSVTGHSIGRAVTLAEPSLPLAAALRAEVAKHCTRWPAAPPCIVEVPGGGQMALTEERPAPWLRDLVEAETKPGACEQRPHPADVRRALREQEQAETDARREREIEAIRANRATIAPAPAEVAPPEPEPVWDIRPKWGRWAAILGAA